VSDGRTICPSFTLALSDYKSQARSATGSLIRMLPLRRILVDSISACTLSRGLRGWALCCRP
jgi:hypothetical protein